MRAVDPRLLRHARAARGYLVVTVLLGLAVTGLILAQAALLAHALAAAALDGDRWLFARQDSVEAAWQIVDPVLGDVTPVHPYARGSWGPKEADRLLPAGDTWRDPAG